MTIRFPIALPTYSSKWKAKKLVKKAEEFKRVPRLNISRISFACRVFAIQNGKPKGF
jgi:hypothetical protein